jgi:hypothetical protein
VDDPHERFNGVVGREEDDTVGDRSIRDNRTSEVGNENLGAVDELGLPLASGCMLDCGKNAAQIPLMKPCRAQFCTHSLEANEVEHCDKAIRRLKWRRH